MKTLTGVLGIHNVKEPKQEKSISGSAGIHTKSKNHKKGDMDATSLPKAYGTIHTTGEFHPKLETKAKQKDDLPIMFAGLEREGK